jgi:AcrR family transcriptional regulator
MKRRSYRLQQRAVQQQETRERIVDAAVALHEELGPAATTISALAERAGVQRLTVYRHFASEQEILQACSATWFSRHPPPDLTTLPAGDPAQRLRAILASLYGYYRETQGMWRSLYRDVGKIEALDEPMRQFDDYLRTVSRDLLDACGSGAPKRLRATAGHAVRFSTWQSLHEQGLGTRAMADLVAGWMKATAA